MEYEICQLSANVNGFAQVLLSNVSTDESFLVVVQISLRICSVWCNFHWITMLGIYRVLSRHNFGFASDCVPLSKKSQRWSIFKTWWVQDVYRFEKVQNLRKFFQKILKSILPNFGFRCKLVQLRKKFLFVGSLFLKFNWL